MCFSLRRCRCPVLHTRYTAVGLVWYGTNTTAWHKEQRFRIRTFKQYLVQQYGPAKKTRSAYIGDSSTARKAETLYFLVTSAFSTGCSSPGRGEISCTYERLPLSRVHWFHIFLDSPKSGPRCFLLAGLVSFSSVHAAVAVTNIAAFGYQALRERARISLRIWLDTLSPSGGTREDSLLAYHYQFGWIYKDRFISI